MKTVGTICKTLHKGRNRVAWMFTFAATGLSEAGTQAFRHVRRLVLATDRQARSGRRSQPRNRPQENEEVAGLYRPGVFWSPYFVRETGSLDDRVDVTGAKRRYVSHGLVIRLQVPALYLQNRFP